jgi:hypothetical protein
MEKRLKIHVIRPPFALISGTPAAGLKTMVCPVQTRVKGRMIYEQPDLKSAL